MLETWLDRGPWTRDNVHGTHGGPTLFGNKAYHVTDIAADPRWPGHETDDDAQSQVMPSWHELGEWREKLWTEQWGEVPVSAGVIRDPSSGSVQNLSFFPTEGSPGFRRRDFAEVAYFKLALQPVFEDRETFGAANVESHSVGAFCSGTHILKDKKGK